MLVKNVILRGARALGFFSKRGNAAKKVAQPIQIASSGAKNAVNNVGNKVVNSDLLSILNDYDRSNPNSFINSFNVYMF